MKTIQKQKTLAGHGQTQMKRDTKRERTQRKTLKEMERQTGERFYLVEGICFDYCC